MRDHYVLLYLIVKAQVLPVVLLRDTDGALVLAAFLLSTVAAYDVPQGRGISKYVMFVQ